MNGNLFAKEMKRALTGLLLWMLIITILIAITMSIYPTFLQNQQKVFGMLNLIPKGVLQFKGFSNINDLLLALGFYASNNVIYMMVLGSIFAIVLGSNILLKEEYNKTAEYLLAKPLTRREIFLTKLSVLSVNIILLNLVTSTAGFTFLTVVDKEPFSIRAFMVLSFYTFLLNILFGIIGLFISTLIRRARPVTAFSIGLVLIFYFVYTLSKITESISRLGYISPFNYVDLKVTSPGYHIEPVNLSVFILLSLILGIFSYRLYLRRDIYL
ncbi:MAG: ABC transporter permease subunit [Bacteroidota bacterium]|nr:ABC transporter permease subunit [Bacteroidota bacterium]